MVQYDFNKVYVEEKKPICVCEKQMPLIDGQDHTDKYIDTSREILSQEMTICNTEFLIFIF